MNPCISLLTCFSDLKAVSMWTIASPISVMLCSLRETWVRASSLASTTWQIFLHLGVLGRVDGRLRLVLLLERPDGGLEELLPPLGEPGL